MKDQIAEITFETLIKDLPPDTQESLRNEFARLTENGRDSFNTLFALAYGQGAIDGANRIQRLVERRNEILRRSGL